MKYFDYASTTPLNPEVLKTYTEVLSRYYVNSESIYPAGLEVNKLMNKSRQAVADLLRVDEKEIIFTSGGSEASNLAIKGTYFRKKDVGRHIITTSVEHSSVLNSCRWLEKNTDCKVTYLPVNEKGVISVEDLEKAMTSETILVSIMYVNNESGAIMPIDEVKKIVRRYPNCYLHVDCVQALGKMPLDFTDIDMASFSAHKIHGLKGSGILLKKQHVQLVPLISGGQQEGRLRGGTANAPANMVWGKTLRLAMENMEKKNETVREYNRYVRDELAGIDKVVINSPEDATPYILNFSCLSIQSEVMMNALSLKGYCVSAQSTCESQQATSHVISQMYRDEARLKGVIRVSFSPEQSWQDIRGFIRDLKEIIVKYG